MRTPKILLLSLLLIPACSGDGQKGERQPPTVRVEPVALHDFVDRYDAVGTAVANEQVIVTAPVTERITQLGFADGDFVSQGQMLAVLAQGQESAALAGASAQTREAEQRLNRLATLRAQGFATKSDLEAQAAQAALARAQAAQARAQIADRVIRAPFSGQVSLRRISVGAVVSAGSEIATISDVRRIKLDFTVPETLLGTIRVGQPISARAAAFPDQPIAGQIAAIDSVIDPTSRAVTLRALLANGDGKLKPGMLLSVTIETQPRRAVAVPELALVRDGEKRFVYIIDDAGKAKRLAVSVGGNDRGLIEIRKGLAPGTRIVTEGVVKLSDGAKVTLADARTAK